MSSHFTKSTHSTHQKSSKPKTRPRRSIPARPKQTDLSPLEQVFKDQLDTAGFTGYETQYKFQVDTYKAYPAWFWDFAFPQFRLLIDLDGGFEHVNCSKGTISCDGFHQLPDGRARDNSKSNEASLSGWKVIRFTESQVHSRQAIATIRRAICDAMEGSH